MTCLYIFNIFIKLFRLSMKTGVFGSLHNKIITKKKNFFADLVLYIHSTTPVPKRKISCCNFY